jgi:hypothetical protein
VHQDKKEKSMRKLKLDNYNVIHKVPDNMNPGKLIEIQLPYAVKDSILNLMFIKELQLTSAELVRQNMLAMKIESCKDSDILLEEEEWNRIKKAVNTFKGFARDDIELVARILDAEEIKKEA